MAALAIALFAPYLPAPAVSGGRIRIHRLAQGLAELGEVELFAAASDRELAEQSGRPELLPYRQVHVARVWLKELPGLFVPARVRRARPSALVGAFQRVHERRPFDVIVAEHSHAAAVAFTTELPWVLDEHNVESEYLAAHTAAAGRTGLWARREIRSLARWERKLWRAADEVVCVSRADADRVACVRERSAELIPNGVATPEIPFKPPSRRSGSEILFVGLLSHPPNVAAARFLAREVLPLVARRVPSARLVLCGARPAREVQALAAENVEVTGTVASVAPYLEAAAVYANPLAHGGGTSLKVLEALAAGVPLVSTAVGVRGFDLSPPRDYLAAERSDEFAEAIVRCLREPASRDEAARHGRKFAEGYDWRDLARRFASVVERAVDRRKQAAGKGG